MPDRQHMDSQLVGAAGDGGQLDAAVVAAAFKHAPEGQCVLALLVVDDVARLGRRIVAQRQVNAAAVLFGLAPRSDERRVGKEWVSTFSSRGSPYHSKKK